uniref:Uncharacterized protein n=1 Tax=Strigamia maritima TaxID=126957 RepID=T1IWH0_STRMM
MHRKKVRELKRITKTHVQMKLEESTLTTIGIKPNRKLLIIYQIFPFLITITILLLCTYQCSMQIGVYIEKPIKVDADIREVTLGDFPAIHIVAVDTDDSLKYERSVRKANLHIDVPICRNAVVYVIENKTTLHNAMKRKNFTKLVKTITYSRGSKKHYNKFKTSEIFSILGLVTRIEN